VARVYSLLAKVLAAKQQNILDCIGNNLTYYNIILMLTPPELGVRTYK
jgi:hypothetical protein